MERAGVRPTDERRRDEQSRESPADVRRTRGTCGRVCVSACRRVGVSACRRCRRVLRLGEHGERERDFARTKLNSGLAARIRVVSCRGEETRDRRERVGGRRRQWAGAVWDRGRREEETSDIASTHGELPRLLSGAE